MTPPACGDRPMTVTVPGWLSLPCGVIDSFTLKTNEGSAIFMSSSGRDRLAGPLGDSVPVGEEG